MYTDLTARPRWWILDGSTPTPAASLTAWAEWFACHPCAGVVAQTRVGAVTVTTRFIGIDRTITGEGPPDLFETRLDGESLPLVLPPCSTWADAVERHGVAVSIIESEQRQPDEATRAAWPTRICSAFGRAVKGRPGFFRSTKQEPPQCQSD
jgi:hypothetical protein